MTGAGVVALLTGTVVAHGAADDHRRPRAVAAAASHPTSAAPVSGSAAFTRPRPQPSRVFVVGDSLTVGAEPWLRTDLRHRGWSLSGVDARVGRPVAEGLGILRARAARLPDTVVIALGTNDLGADPATVAGWLRSARVMLGDRRIVWVNLCLADGVDPRLAAYRHINAALEKSAPRFGIQVADWCAYAAAHKVAPGPDGIHYSAAGYQQRALFYAASLVATAPARRSRIG